MIALMIKRHNVTGLKYLHKSSVHASEEYIGSGTRWKKHIKKHGPDVTTLWEESFHEDEVEEIALFISEELNVVQSEEWANLIPENGLDGRPKGYRPPKETGEKISFAKTGKKRSKESCDKQSKTMMGPGNHFYGKTHTDECRKNMSEKARIRSVGAGNTNAKPIVYRGEKFGCKKFLTEKYGISLYMINKMIKSGEIVHG